MHPTKIFETMKNIDFKKIEGFGAWLIKTYDFSQTNPHWKYALVYEIKLVSLQKFLREEHNINIFTLYAWEDKFTKMFQSNIESDEWFKESKLFKTYELALEEGLKQSLTLIK